MLTRAEAVQWLKDSDAVEDDGSLRPGLMPPYGWHFNHHADGRWEMCPDLMHRESAPIYYEELT